MKSPGKALASARITLSLVSLAVFASCGESPTSPLDPTSPLYAVAPSSALEIWWPTEGAWLLGTHLFKARLAGQSLGDYRMYWQVDGGSLVSMGDSYVDAPHKEAQVNVGSWTWRGSGPYVLTFVAKDRKTKSTLAQRNVSIRVGKAPVAVAAVEVTPPSASTLVGGKIQLAAITRDVAGNVLTGRATAWASSAPGIATVDGAGLVSTIAAGSATISATSEGVSGTAVITVSNPVAVALVGVTPPSASTEVGGKIQLAAITRDAAGNVLTGRATAWASSAPGIATVDGAGLVSTIAAGSATISATSEGVSGTAVITVSAPPPVGPSANPLAGAKFYVDPYSSASTTANSWRTSQPANAAQMDKLASQSQADWLGGWSGDIYTAVSNRVATVTSAGAVPVFIAYNIPARDCGGYSAGGSNSPEGYRTWIRDMARALTGRKAVVVLEPDALSGMDCLSLPNQDVRVQLIREAVQTLAAIPTVSVYIDAGHPKWKSPSVIAARLTAAGIAGAAGFAINVSNFIGNADNKTYGQAISNLLGGNVHFIIDSSRNGLGPTADYQWCNPGGRALGTNPTTVTNHPLVDAFLWLKRPGESDGSCNGGPSAGSWWATYALGLAQRQTSQIAASTNLVVASGMVP